MKIKYLFPFFLKKEGRVIRQSGGRLYRMLHMTIRNTILLSLSSFFVCRLDKSQMLGQL